jgi:hypothetical protein
MSAAAACGVGRLPVRSRVAAITGTDSPGAGGGGCRGRNRARGPAAGMGVWGFPRHSSRTAQIASSSGMTWVTSLRLPPVSETTGGVLYASVITWCCGPGRARSTGLGQAWAAPQGTHLGADRGTGEVQLVGAARFRQQHRRRPPSDAGLVPVPQPAPADHPSRSLDPAARTRTESRYAARTRFAAVPAGFPVLGSRMSAAAFGSRGSIGTHTRCRAPRAWGGLLRTSSPVAGC